MASEKIVMTIDDVKACKDMGAGQQDAYCDMLLATGKAANGLNDQERPKATAGALESIAICMTRDAMHRIPDMEAAMEKVITRVVSAMLKAHAKDCPLADQIPTLVTEAMRAEAIRDDGAWTGEERRGRDGRDGRDIMVGVKGSRFSGPAWALAVISLCAVAIVAMLKFG